MDAVPQQFSEVVGSFLLGIKDKASSEVR